MKDSDKFIHKKEKFPVEGGVLGPGHYDISFKFGLPNNCPSSFMYKSSKYRFKPKAKVKYFVKVKINDDFKAK